MDSWEEARNYNLIADRDTKIEKLEQENAELRVRARELNWALARLENFLEVTVTYAVSKPKRDYAEFVLKTLHDDLSPKQEEEEE